MRYSRWAISILKPLTLFSKNRLRPWETCCNYAVVRQRTTAHENPLRLQTGLLAKSTHLMMPISTNALVSGGSSFPFSYRPHFIVAAHRIRAVYMKSESSTRCLPTQTRRPNPNDTWPSRFVSFGPGNSSPLSPRCLSGLNSSTSSPNMARS